MAALRGDLDTIVLTCLQPEAQRRYATAAALRDDLQRWREGRPISAQPDRLAYRVGKFVRRHRRGVAASALALLLLLGALGFSLVQRHRAEQARDHADALAA